MEITIPPARRISGSVTVPGDKSISHRALIAAAMTTGACRLRGLSTGEDVASTITCLRALGFEVSRGAGGPGEEVIVRGNSWAPSSRAELDAGNSGTTLRLLAGALAGASGEYVIGGDRSLSRRPMGRVAEPLRLMGAEIELSEGDRPPLQIRGGPLSGIEYRQPIPSAQVKGAVLLAGLQADGTTRVVEPLQSRDHTERLLRWLGAGVDMNDGSVTVSGGPELFSNPGFEIDIPGDLSSAAYFLAAAILASDGRVEIEGVGLNPTRTGFLDILRAMGAEVGIEAADLDPEPQGKLTAESGDLKGIELSGDHIPSAIDELPLVALAATQATGTTVVTGASELRVKESDRINTLTVALKQLGASIAEQPDGWVIEGPSRLKGGRVNPGGDHRIALTLAVAATLAEEPVTIAGWECTEISFPQFHEKLANLVS